MMSEYIIVRTEGIYKIYRRCPGSDLEYQYCGATFVMYVDAEDFVNMKLGSNNAS